MVYELEIFHMGLNNGNPVLVSEKKIIFTQQKVQKRPLCISGGLWAGWMEVFIVSLLE